MDANIRFFKNSFHWCLSSRFEESAGKKLRSLKTRSKKKKSMETVKVLMSFSAGSHILSVMGTDRQTDRRVGLACRHTSCRGEKEWSEVRPGRFNKPTAFSFWLKPSSSAS